MAQINPPKPLRSTQKHELREDQLTTAYARSATFFEQHRTAVIGAAIGLVVLVAGLVGFSVYRSNQAERAQEALGAILTQYEQGNYQAALEGTDTAPGLLEIADRYGSSTGQLATFFAADALYQLGRYDEALRYFERVRTDGIVGASALAGQAAVYEQRGDYARAARLYERAAGAYDSEATVPGYLMDAGRAFEAAGDTEAARRVYARVADEFAETPEGDFAAIALARVEAAAAAN
ncbi:MAG: tetratricopeptide repeat protein [Rubricoccaceae bacterium]